MAGIVDSEAVIDFLTAVQRKDDVMHFLVAEFRYLIVQEDAVCRKGEADILIVELFLLSSVCNELLYDIPVHERLAAEEVDIKVLVEA